MRSTGIFATDERGIPASNDDQRSQPLPSPQFHAPGNASPKHSLDGPAHDDNTNSGFERDDAGTQPSSVAQRCDDQRRPGAHDDEDKMLPLGLPETRTVRCVFGRFASFGPWRLDVPFSSSENCGLDLLSSVSCSLDFSRENCSTSGINRSGCCGSGAQRESAIPCADMLLDASWRRQNVTVKAWRASGQRSGESMSENRSLHCVMTVDACDSPQEIDCQIVRFDGEVVCHARLSRKGDGRLRPRRFEPEIVLSEHVAKSGVWVQSYACAHGGQRCFTLWRMADLPLTFRTKRVRHKSKMTSKSFTFGVYWNQNSCALPCADLHWDGSSWIGKLTMEAWRGEGRAAMDALWQDVERGLDASMAENMSLQCVLTVDAAADPQAIDWQIVRSHGEVICCARLSRKGGGGLRPRRLAQEILLFEHLAKSGVWARSSLAHRDNFSLMRMADLPLTFQTKTFRRNGFERYALLTFGMYWNAKNYALPCADLRWYANSWIGNLTMEAWRGEGRAAMDGFREDVEQRLGEGGSGSVSVQCVLTADRFQNPEWVFWQILRSGGEVVFRVRLSHVRDRFRWPRTFSGKFARFVHSARPGVGTPSDDVVHSSQRLATLIRSADLRFNFRTKTFWRNSRSTGAFLAFGVYWNQNSCALPCTGLRLDGTSWVGCVTREAWRGAGAEVMDAFWADIEQRLGEDMAGNVSLKCLLTVDAVDYPQAVDWKIARSDGEAVMSFVLKRQSCGAGGFAM